MTFTGIARLAIRYVSDRRRFFRRHKRALAGNKSWFEVARIFISSFMSSLCFVGQWWGVERTNKLCTHDVNWLVNWSALWYGKEIKTSSSHLCPISSCWSLAECGGGWNVRHGMSEAVWSRQVRARLMFGRRLRGDGHCRVCRVKRTHKVHNGFLWLQNWFDWMDNKTKT